MAFRSVFQRISSKVVNKPWEKNINVLFENVRGRNGNFQTSRFSRSKLVPVCLGLGLGGALYFRQRKYSLPDLFLLRATSEEGKVRGGKDPCVKSRPKMAAPCNKKKRGAEPQSNVISGLKKYSLFLWITLEPDADPCAVACAAVKIDEAIAATQGFDCDIDDEVLAGVGFGPNFLCQNCLSPSKNFCYRARKGKRGEMPSSNGDIFVHAKADSLGQLFDFCKIYLHGFPDDSVSEFEDCYGFSYRGSRDISGFLINQTNRCKEEDLRKVAVESSTGGSYALAQKWVHDLCALEEDPSVLEKYIGRKMESGEELEERSPSSHLTRITGSSEPGAEPKYEIVQQNMSYGTLSERAGMFFLSFAKDPCVFDWMLDRMVGANCDDGQHDDAMRISKNVKGTYWYFPGLKEIANMKGAFFSQLHLA
ncbi:Dyp-type peroxidase yfex-like protein [Plakobranchus ocellatus]|uniref:Dyp-type peroxidase yfex-like protein n=1 Tax=Plakobranchus ocellatus TaxID=259542 RepID=A0AAV4DNH3_9GAST|nr:Dyp-type peroxidase yfex-like protein [Plakobranchus ocellatus]